MGTQVVCAWPESITSPVWAGWRLWWWLEARRERSAGGAKNARGVWKSSKVRMESFSLFSILIASFRGELVK